MGVVSIIGGISCDPGSELRVGWKERQRRCAKKWDDQKKKTHTHTHDGSVCTNVPTGWLPSISIKTRSTNGVNPTDLNLKARSHTINRPETRDAASQQIQISPSCQRGTCLLGEPCMYVCGHMRWPPAVVAAAVVVLCPLSCFS